MTTEVGIWLALSDFVLIVHAAYIVFVVGGQMLIVAGWALHWIWTRHLLFRLCHLCAIGFVMLVAWFNIPCPLTSLENYLRARADIAGYERSFIGHWLEHLIFYVAPEWIFTSIYTAFAVLVLLTWLAYPPQRRPQ